MSHRELTTGGLTDLFKGFLRHWANTGGLVRPTYDQVDGWAPNTYATAVVWIHLCELGIAQQEQREPSADFVEVDLPSGATLNLSRDDAESLVLDMARQLGGGPLKHTQ